MGQFDYLSTVSGGGYIGTFFLSLFIKGRAQSPSTDRQAARLAHDALRSDPPGRIRTTMPKAYSMESPGAWLRENARYLAPTSAGDALYGMTTMIRAWFAEQYVIGTFLLMLLSVLGLFKLGTYELACWLNAYLGSISSTPALSGATVLAQPIEPQHGFWMSPLWMLPLASTVLALIPCGCAFWMTYPARGQSLHAGNMKPNALIWGMLALGSICLWLGYLVFSHWHGSLLLSSSAFAIGWSALLMSLWYGFIARKSTSLATLRVSLTRHLTQWVNVTAALAYLAMVDTLAQTIYYQKHDLLVHAVAAVAASWAAHRFGPVLNQMVQHRKNLRIPLNVVLAASSVILVTLLLLFWDWILLNIQWANFIGVPAQPAATYTFDFQLINLVVTLGLTALLVIIVGHYPEFNNLSTLAGLYSARLTRAYQGASNAERFEHPETMSSAEPLESDHIAYATYNANQYAPMHIINVCLNQNVDPAEQLVQRDRKGKPLAILPKVGAGRMRFAIDGDLYEEPAKDPDVLTIGEWIGVSGAAVSTGSGRGTTAATALLLGLANVRLGRWWSSGTARSFEKKDRNPFARAFRATLPTQAYLLDELLARFYGTRRKLQYLSDGGHFDNTGIYELLREERKISLIVACDCGADPDYTFGDLANLIRLARIDFKIDIVVDRSIIDPALLPLGAVFGTPEELATPPDATTTKCAILLHVFRSGKSREKDIPDTTIVLIKPRLVASAPLDVHQYAGSNAPFPQQTTGDQFFDEAQWESYRKLGLEIGNLIFGNPTPGYRAALATALLRARPSQ
jgi:hypothetical protein